VDHPKDDEMSLVISDIAIVQQDRLGILMPQYVIKHKEFGRSGDVQSLVEGYFETVMNIFEQLSFESPTQNSAHAF
jgi:hypothetical protein